MFLVDRLCFNIYILLVMQQVNAGLGVSVYHRAKGKLVFAMMSNVIILSHFWRKQS